MASINSNATGTTTSSSTTVLLPEAKPTLSERELLRIEFYKTYDVMTGVRIAATLGSFFGLMVLLVIYKSRCKSNRQLEDPRLKAAAAAAVAEAEAEEQAIAAALEAIARLPSKPERGTRRSLCAEVIEPRLPLVGPRFASVGGDYDSLLAALPQGGRYTRAQRRCSSITCSSTASSYLERRGSAMVMPSLPPLTRLSRHAAYREPWDHPYHPSIDIQVIQPTPELSPCGSEAGLYSAIHQQHAILELHQDPSLEYQYQRRAPLASMGSVDPPDQDSRSLGSDSVFASHHQQQHQPDTEDEVSGFSTDSSDGIVSMGRVPSNKAMTSSGRSRNRRRRSLLRVPPKRKRPPDRWDRCAGCVPRRRSPPPPAPCLTCMTISASVEAPR
ncbi:hypothetical protein QAD02_011997 [Eretmocerus hayati]|uniref:Uncharacterized protein n=1 Tax=Eretmocerus hayati TaxID=131215 RepID=A0ACC2P043_9HYME|nr:hypothetical protein QAD02_011997 [Eretmocerus hayati]